VNCTSLSIAPTFLSIAAIMLLFGCSEQSRIDYPRDWSPINSAASLCQEIDGDFADHGSAAEPQMETQRTPASFIRLIASGAIVPTSIADHIHVHRSHSGRVHVEWLSESGQTHSIDLDDDRCEHRREVRPPVAGCDSGRSVSLCFFLAADGSLLVDERARQPDMEWLAIPVEEEYEYWFRFSRAM
jgi:hypothetical protein